MNSVGKNAFYNIIKQICSVFFPLITLPYVSRVLQTENYGIFSFSSSFISYISLVACLGISTYAVREGARIRYSKNEVKKFVNEVFTINAISTVIALLSMILIVNFVGKMTSYKYVIYVLAINIVFTTIGTEWINTIYEDFAYIAARYVATHLLSLLLLFLLVRSKEDTLWYAVVYISGNVCANIVNFFYIRRKYDLHPKLVPISFNSKHIVPVLVLFSSGIALNIYINSDVTILGIIKDDYAVGIYAVATRVYFMVKTMINSATTVVIPRASSMLNDRTEKEKVTLLYTNTLSAVVLITIPALVGLISVSDDVILLISGEEYLLAAGPLRILSVALIFATLGSVFVNCILTPHRKEKTVLWFTVFSAITNIVLNIILIPWLSYIAAAITTVIAEMIMCFFGYYYSKKICDIRIPKEMIISLIGGVVIAVICLLCRKVIDNYVLRLIVSVGLSVIFYICLLLTVKDNIVYSKVKSMRRNRSEY